MQQGVQTDATCNIQQCWKLLANTVASVCTGLNGLYLGSFLLEPEPLVWTYKPCSTCDVISCNALSDFNARLSYAERTHLPKHKQMWLILSKENRERHSEILTHHPLVLNNNFNNFHIPPRFSDKCLVKPKSKQIMIIINWNNKLMIIIMIMITKTRRREKNGEK